jgi:hypothetical protein
MGKHGVFSMIRAAGMLITLAAVLSVFFVPSATVSGAPLPVDLQLNGAGSEAWNITSIKPGDSGTEMLTIHNAGYASGVLYIWVSDIADSTVISSSVPIDPAEAAQLSRSILFTIGSNRLSANIPLPATLNDFPDSAGDTARITISPIAAGETIDLVWQWKLPVTAGNAVQGKKVSFTINYMLEEMPAAPVVSGGGIVGGISLPPTQTASTKFIVTSPEKQTTLAILADGTVAETQTIEIISKQITLSLERGTKIFTQDNSVPNELRVTIPETAPPPPPGMTFVGNVYELTFYVGGEPRAVTLSEPARLIFNYDLLQVPDNVIALFMATYDSELGWSQLQPISGFIAEEGQVGALTNHFSTFAILAQSRPDAPETTVPVITSPAITPLPARFEVSTLTLSTKQINSGEPVTIRVHVANTGELSGEYLLTLKMNGLFLNSKLVTLAPGQNRNVSFVISPYTQGTYEVEINGLRETFTVSGEIITEDGSGFWPVPGIPIIIGVSGSIIILAGMYYFFKKRRQT